MGRAADARDVLHADDFKFFVGKSVMFCQYFPTGQQDWHVTIFHAEADAVVWIGRDEGEKSSMCFQNALLGIVSIFRPLQQHSHEGVLV